MQFSFTMSTAYFLDISRATCNIVYSLLLSFKKIGGLLCNTGTSICFQGVCGWHSNHGNTSCALASENQKSEDVRGFLSIFCFRKLPFQLQEPQFSRPIKPRSQGRVKKKSYCFFSFCFSVWLKQDWFLHLVSCVATVLIQ